MRAWGKTIAKLAGGGFFLLESLYCVLAFVPYTFHFLVHAPPYAWMVWLTQHHTALYWVAGALLAYGYHGSIAPKAWWTVVATTAVMGAVVSKVNLLPALRNDWNAYVWSLALLLPALLAALADVKRYRPAHQEHAGAHLSYSRALLVAGIIPLLWTAGADLRAWHESTPMSLHGREGAAVLWMVVSHLWLAILVISALNLFHSALDRRATHPATLRLRLITGLVWATTALALVKFSRSSLTFDGWPAWLYGALFAATLTGVAASALLPFLRPDLERPTAAATTIFPAVLGGLLLLAGLAAPTAIGEGDWNGLLQQSVVLALWIGLGVCAYLVRPRPKTYSVVAIVAVLLVAATLFFGLKFSAVMWAKDIAPTDDEFARNLEKLSSRNPSYAMVHSLLEEKFAQPCGEMCRTIRQYTNIRNAELRFELPLVDGLKPVTGARPNIFIIVVDSLRPDYVGAYNPQVDFTPNLDAFAKDSVVFTNAYSQYAGTHLSEAAIWTGITMLHAHYVRPFDRVNNLEKMAKVDGYQTVVSWDTILRIILDENNVVKFDADKQWNTIEFSTTLEQFERFLATRTDTRPMLFYTQPCNVQQLAFNHLPRRSSANWRERAGFNNRIAFQLNQFDAYWGEFIALLKRRGLYDDSIIIVASDHGEATGELGRIAHSTLIYPEIMRVPLIVHLPRKMRESTVHDPNAVTALIDIAPSLFYLLGHRPIRKHELYGRPLFTETRDELESYRRQELLLASDVRAAYGLLLDNGRTMYTVYDEPAKSYLFDLELDPLAQHNIVNDDLQRNYNRRLVEYLQMVADLYGYKATGGN